MQCLKQSTTATIMVGPVLDSAGAAVTTAVLADFNITKNGTTATLTGATVTHSHNGHYTIALTTGNTDTLGRLTITVNNSAMAMAPFRYTILAAAAFDTLVTNGTLASSTSGRTIAVDASGFLTVATNNDKTGYSLTQSFPSNFSSLAITAGGAVTAGTVSDKTGYSLASGGLSAVTAWTVAITGDITGSLSGNVGGIAGTTTTLDALQTALNAAHGSGSWATATGFSTHTAADVWAVGTRTITGGSLTTAPPTAAAIATAVLTTQMTESYAAVGTAPTLAQSQFAIKQHLENSAISGTTQTVYKIDGTTVAMTFTLDSATSPTSIARAT